MKQKLVLRGKVGFSLVFGIQGLGIRIEMERVGFGDSL